MRVSMIFCAALLCSALASAQVPVRGLPGVYREGPFVPLMTTPEVSLDTAAPAAVGASNATFGLEAGARNSTFETMNDHPGSNYTEPVWYSGGGAPVISPEVSLEPRPMHMHREMHIMMQEHMGEHAEGAAAHEWTFYGASEMDQPVNVSAGRGAKHATRTITNDDIDRANQNTGTVKYNGKTEKIQ